MVSALWMSKQQPRKKSCRSSSKSGHFFFSGPNCSAVLDLFEYYSTIWTCYSNIIYIHIYSVTQYTPSVTILNVLYIYTHIIYISSVTQYTGVLQY